MARSCVTTGHAKSSSYITAATRCNLRQVIWAVPCSGPSEATSLLAVAVPDQQPEPGCAVAEVHNKVARLLGHPGTAGAGGDSQKVTHQPTRRGRPVRLDPCMDAPNGTKKALIYRDVRQRCITPSKCRSHPRRHGVYLPSLRH